MRRILSGAVACVLFASAALGQRVAQVEQPSEADKAAYEAAFQETLRKPNDPAVVLHYAELAVKIGNLEGAISALERLLLIEGDQPRIKLEIGVLYYRLRSYEAARTYLEAARTSPIASSETKERAKQFLTEIDGEVKKSQFAGQFLTGIRYSTNANSGPSGPISSFGSSTVPTPTVSGRPDFGVIGAAALQHRYDLGRQDGGALETDLSLYGARQFQVGEANVWLADLVIGPKTRPFGGWAESVSVKPLFMGRYIAVHDLPTYSAWGFGAEVAADMGSGSQAALTLYGRRREYINNDDAPTNTNSSGDEGTTNLEFRARISSAVTLSFDVNFTRYLAWVPSENFTQTGFATGLNWRFADPLGMNGRTWVAALNFSYDHADYDQPDPTVDPNVRRQQNDYNLGLTLAVPLDGRLTLIGQGGYTKRDASLTNYAYDSLNILTGLSWRF